MLKILSKQTSSKKTRNSKTYNLNKEDSLIRHAPVFENIPFHLNALKNSQEMFDQFMKVVEEDVKSKSKVLKSLRLNNQLNTN